jgi:transcriptional regulator with XRE-family HTH domain
MSIRIDPEFESLIPPLTADEFKQLEENCVAEGIRDPLVVWSTGKPGDDDILVDGHNRWKISAHHGGILFTTKRIMFRDRDEVKAWIIQNQFGRRNLSAYDRSVLALKLKPLIQEKAKEKETERKTTYQKSEKSNMPTVNTTKELAKAAGVSHDTIHKVEKIEAEASEKTKQAIRNGDISINHAFNNLPSQRNKDIVKEAKRQAQKEHLEYLEEKASGTVSIESAKKEKSNMHLLSLEASTQIHKIVRSVMELPLIASDDAIRYLGENMKHIEYLELESDLRTATSVITKLRKELEQAHGKRNL